PSTAKTRLVATSHKNSKPKMATLLGDWYLVITPKSILEKKPADSAAPGGSSRSTSVGSAFIDLFLGSGRISSLFCREAISTSPKPHQRQAFAKYRMIPSI